MYTYSTTIRLQHTDAAGIVFFPNLFTIAHECYETYLEPEVIFDSMVNQYGLIIPVVYAEAEYHKPLRISEKITIIPRLKEIGNSSFSIEFTVNAGDGDCAATIKTSHVLRDKKHNEAAPLTPELREKLLLLSDS